MDDEKLCLISIGLVILIFAGLAGMTYIDEEGWPWQDDEKDEEEVLLIQEGDEVTVDYVGRFIGSAGEPGPVFDTSIPEVARDPTIPKAQGFVPKTTYDDLTFTVGSGQMIKGFEEAVLGKKINQNITVAIPPEKAYGEAHEELVLTINSTQKILMKETISREKFEKMFPMIDLELPTFVHPFWGWDVNIVSYDPEEVSLWHQPVYGQEYRGFTWNTTVVDISTERNVITLHHNVDEIRDDTKVFFEMANLYDPYWGESASGVNPDEPPREALITSVGGTITIDFNRPVAGKTLIFSITIKDIKRE
ncbi:MAG: FKBP-type peptidyl-prolyl cis-trans isomerase [Thermoplasmatota archaeon]